MLPQRLLKFQPSIENHHRELMANPDVQPIRYYRETWEKHFDADADFADVAGRYPQTVSRGNLQELSREAHEDSAQARKLFLAAMLWGYGTSGYGAWRTRKMTASLEQDAELLADTFANIRLGGLLAAHQDFGFQRKLERCGEAFFTKFFYAIALGTEIRPMALVLDSRVRYSLNELARIGELKYSGDYLEYIQLMDGWARELNCRADAIEMSLFQPPPEFYESA